MQRNCLSIWRATQKEVILSRISRFDLRRVRIMIAGFSKCDFRNLGKILSGHIFFSKKQTFFFKTKNSMKNIFRFFLKKKFEISHKARFHENFPYKAISHKVHWFSVIFKDNLEALFLAEACLSFPECFEQFLGSLET